MKDWTTNTQCSYHLHQVMDEITHPWCWKILRNARDFWRIWCIYKIPRLHHITQGQLDALSVQHHISFSEERREWRWESCMAAVSWGNREYGWWVWSLFNKVSFHGECYIPTLHKALAFKLAMQMEMPLGLQEEAWLWCVKLQRRALILYSLVTNCYNQSNIFKRTSVLNT